MNKIIELETKLFNIEYWIGSKHVETIAYAKKYPLARRIVEEYKKKENYKSGKFVIKDN